jgi:hypothetical protein
MVGHQNFKAKISVSGQMSAAHNVCICRLMGVGQRIHPEKSIGQRTGSTKHVIVTGPNVAVHAPKIRCTFVLLTTFH